jgi:hypothetical protein
MKKECHKDKKGYPTVQVPEETAAHNLICQILNAFIGIIKGGVKIKDEEDTGCKLKDEYQKRKSTKKMTPVYLWYF